MKYFLFKLKFTTPLHIGSSDSSHSLESAEMTFSADTLFSALCHTAVKSGCLDALVSAAMNGSLLLSDAFPYAADAIYLPKPMLPARVNRNSDPSDRKKFKKLKYIPARLYGDYLESLRSGVAFDINGIQPRFGETSVYERVSMRDEVASPYSVGAFGFFEGCGLYVIVGCEDGVFDSFASLFGLLGLGGIGGKTSSGCGKFSVSDVVDVSSRSDADTAALDLLLSVSDANMFITLTAFTPNDEELDSACENGYSQLVRRSGFVCSSEIFTAVKKSTQYGFAAGSCFDRRYKGSISDVGYELPHPVYRYGNPVYLGVSY